MASEEIENECQTHIRRIVDQFVERLQFATDDDDSLSHRQNVKQQLLRELFQSSLQATFAQRDTPGSGGGGVQDSIEDPLDLAGTLF